MWRHKNGSNPATSEKLQIKYTSLTFLNTGMHYCEGRWGLLGWVMCLSHVISWWVMWLLGWILWQHENTIAFNSQQKIATSSLCSQFSTPMPRWLQVRICCKLEFWHATLSNQICWLLLPEPNLQRKEGAILKSLSYIISTLLLLCPCAHAQPHLLVLPQ